MADENETRVYGMPDGNDRAAPPAEGLRGERSTLAAKEGGNPALRRRVTLDTGAIVEVREESGVGWAEAVGRAGLVENGAEPAEERGAGGPPADPSVMPRQRTGAFARTPRAGKLLLALAAAAGVGMAAAVYRRRRRLTASA